MAPIPKRGQKGNSRLDSILAFAAKLERTLRHAVETLPSLTDSLHRNIESIDLIPASAVANKSRDLDEQGTTIWNLTSKHKEDAVLADILALARAFASLLLDRAQQLQSSAAANDIRVFKITLKASRWCLDRHQLGITEQIIERAAFYEKRLQRVSEDDSAQNLASTSRRLCNEYHILRIASEWRRERLDLADIWLTKLGHKKVQLEAAVAEQLADTLCEIGRDQAKKQQYESAIQWLERAYDVFDIHDPKDLSIDAGALKSSISHCLVQALIKERCEENNLRAWNIIQELENEGGITVAISLLKLQVLVGDLSAAQDYYDVLLHVVRQIHLSDVNVRTILHYVHELKRRSARLAHTMLVVIISERLLAMDEIFWVENTVITLVWNCTTSTDLGDMTYQLEELLNEIAAKSGPAFGASAIHAAQILMVRRIEAAYSQGNYEQADSWCRLALHSMFSNSGESNIGKLQRKRILCAMGRSDFARCQEIHQQMSKATQGDSSTQYLLYKVALRCHDVDLATECLDGICKTSESDSTLLYGCVLEAQKNGHRLQLIRALSRVNQRSNPVTVPGLHLPTLLRLIARLLIEELESQQSKGEECIDELCKVFEGAAAAAKASQQDLAKEDAFPTVELDWFSRNSYNLALKMCAVWKAESTLRIVQACSAFIDLYPLETEPQQASDLSLRRLFCNFLGCCLLVVLARAEDRIQEQLRHYSELRSTMSGFRLQVGTQLSRLEGGATTDLLRKHACLTAFDFEAAARLGSWTSFGDLIEEAEKCGDPKIYNVMADIVLSCEAPIEVVIATLQHIINKVWQPDNGDVDRLARWIRCLFSLALSSNVEMAENIIDQVISIAGNAKEVRPAMTFAFQAFATLTKVMKKYTHYPAEELEWIATTTFNRAVDFYCASQDEASRRWAGRAISLANVGDDDGQLHQLLQNKYLGLAWDR